MTESRRIWCKADWITAGLAAIISLAVYIWSAAPNVTLLDSGEFIVAAEHFGVPHPTGYPLWTFLAWVFQLVVPGGNAAWEINIFSGVCAALAVGLCAALLSNIQNWCFDEKLTGRLRYLPYLVALSFSLMLAFSQSMWSQAVIAEVYALHALLIGIYIAFCYTWVRNPTRDGLMLWAFFFLALAFSNHQLTLALVLPFPLPYLLILLLRPKRLLDWLFAGLLTLWLGYMAFSILSQEALMLKTAIRFGYCVALAFAAFLWLRRFKVRWKIILVLPLAVAAGLFSYAYMPLASSTNPPMNWSYTREPLGLYDSLNRSQYSDSLSELSLKSLGRLMGSAPEAAKVDRAAEKPTLFRQSWLTEIQMWTGFFWQQLNKAFTPFALIGYFASLIFVFRFPLPKRVWIYLLHFAFFLAAFLQPLIANSRIDNAGWWLQMPYHTYTNLIFAILSGLGMGLCLRTLIRRREVYFWVAPVLLILPLFTFLGSEPSSSQRGRWFGWMFGHDMLKDLPAGSVVIGGTDPGRFVPTYMIFGESGEKKEHKRDPDFDRRDLYIITQNALGDEPYMKYLRDQYTEARPKPKNGFERWLGREDAYPKTPLRFPSDEETKKIVEKIKKSQEAVVESGGKPDTSLVFGEILKWLWENNRDQHEFFIEESFPIKWTYDYAIPHGLIYRLNKTKLDTLPAEVVRQDFAFWADYKARLLADPEYRNDYDAQRSFSKLRLNIANIYRHRKMDAEAERAYREAIELWPANGEALTAIMTTLWDQDKFDEVIDLFDRALVSDPNNIMLGYWWHMAGKRKELEGKINGLRDKLAQRPKDSEAVRQLIELYAEAAETNRANPLIDHAIKDFPENTNLLRFFISYFQGTEQPEKMIIPARQLVKSDGSNAENYYLLARALAVQPDKQEFYKAVSTAIEMGGIPLRDSFAGDPAFVDFRDDPEFKKLIEAPLVEKPR